MKAKKSIAVAVAAVIAAGAAGCAPQTGPNEAGGTVLGAVAGGLIGSRFGGGAGKVAAVMAGTMIGGFLGNQIGRGLDERAQQQAAYAQSQAVSYGQRQSWQAPSGARGYVDPGPVYSEQGRVCRQYTHTIYIGGRQEQGVGTACRAPDGRWDIVS